MIPRSSCAPRLTRLYNAIRGRRFGAHRNSRLPTGLAGDAGPADNRSGDDHRRLRRNGGARLLDESRDYVAIVLAIGNVVDDAIVIVEGVSRYVEQGIPGRQAAERAMEELIGPIIGITLVLMAVFFQLHSYRD